MKQVIARITCVVDNRLPRDAKPGLGAEHGLSLHVELSGRQVLLDTGQSKQVVDNASLMGINLSQLDAIILSHGHYDHTGGLLPVLEAREAKLIPVYAHPDIFDEKFTLQRGVRRSIGLPWHREDAEALGARFFDASSWRQVVEGVWVTGIIKRVSLFETGDRQLLTARYPGGPPEQDSLLDDISVVVELGPDNSLAILTGCAHAGMVNIIEAVRRRFPAHKIKAIIGGSHLSRVSKNQLFATLAYLTESEIEMFRLSHCTGEAEEQLAKALAGRYQWFGVGEVVEFN